MARLAKVGVPAVAAVALSAFPGLGQGVALADPATATPIKHLVVIFGENISFDHYFATYPNATNPAGEPAFTALAGTPTPNNLQSAGLLSPSNPNSAQPFRFDRTSHDVMTCSQNHSYNPEQAAFDGGAMDKFVESVGTTGTGATGRVCAKADNMGYYDGNTVTAFWNYAQHFAMSDNSYNTQFGPSTPGAISVTSGNTTTIDSSKFAFGMTTSNGNIVPNGAGGYTLIGDLRPYYDDCNTSAATGFTGQNIGDKLNAAGLSWGWFQGGFKPSTAATTTSDPTGAYNPTTETGKAVCATSHNEGAAIGGSATNTADYIQHHEPFQFYASTANPHHLAPASLNAIGTDTQDYNGSGQPTFDTANHNYDMSDFDSLVSAIAHGTVSADHLPAVSYLKAPAYQDGHAGYSDPLDEQAFVTKEINALEQTPDWSSTAVVLAYDDSDGWYDHQRAVGFPQTGSTSAQDTAMCTGTAPADGLSGRCGYGPRTPLIAISPCAKPNYIDHTLTNQASVVKFIEDNWLSSSRITGSEDASSGSIDNMFDYSNCTQPALFLDTSTGLATGTPDPLLPESHLPITLIGSAAVVAAVGGTVAVRRRRRNA
jgi:phospholipase C